MNLDVFMLSIALFVGVAHTINLQADASVDQSLCCDSTDYSKSNYLFCVNGKDFPTSPISSCATCVSYQCIDWTVGSKANQAREASFYSATGQSVYFAVGSYGSNPNGGGLCYRISSKSIDRDIILQVVNYGTDVPLGNFDVQISDGGFGIYNACTQESTKMPQFDGPASLWGSQHGGAYYRSDCDKIPQQPICGNNPQDTMGDLCRFSFDKSFRLENQGNPTVSAVCQVACPPQLVEATGLRRIDEKNTQYVCKNNFEPGGGFLTKTMDCAKPTYAWPDNVGGPTYPGYSAVVACRRDGYTRVNAMTSNPPTSQPPSRKPSPVPSAFPSRFSSPPPSRIPIPLPSPLPSTIPSPLPTRLPSPLPSLLPTQAPLLLGSSTMSFSQLLALSVSTPSTSLALYPVCDRLLADPPSLRALELTVSLCLQLPTSTKLQFATCSSSSSDSLTASVSVGLALREFPWHAVNTTVARQLFQVLQSRAAACVSSGNASLLLETVSSTLLASVTGSELSEVTACWADSFTLLDPSSSSSTASDTTTGGGKRSLTAGIIIACMVGSLCGVLSLGYVVMVVLRKQRQVPNSPQDPVESSEGCVVSIKSESQDPKEERPQGPCCMLNQVSRDGGGSLAAVGLMRSCSSDSSLQWGDGQ